VRYPCIVTDASYISQVAILEGDTRTMAERMASALSALKKAEEEEQRRLNL
jgi:hypothetical protein